MRLTILCLSGFELYSRWVPVIRPLRVIKDLLYFSLGRGKDNFSGSFRLTPSMHWIINKTIWHCWITKSVLVPNGSSSHCFITRTLFPCKTIPISFLSGHTELKGSFCQWSQMLLNQLCPARPIYCSSSVRESFNTINQKNDRQVNVVVNHVPLIWLLYWTV